VLALSGSASPDGNPAIVDSPPQKNGPGKDVDAPEAGVGAASAKPAAVDPEPERPLAAGDGLEAPLPRGAVVRLGTTRYRTGETVGGLKLSPDGKKLISCDRGGNGVAVWDVTSGKLILRRPLGEEGEISRDGERLFLIESLPLPPPQAKAKLPADTETVIVTPVQPEVKNAFKIYQLSTGKLLQQIDSRSRLAHFAVAPDERTLALEYAIPNVKGVSTDFTADWSFKARVELYDVKAGRVLHKLEELPQSYSGNGLVHFSADGKTLFAVSYAAETKGNQSTVRRFDVEGALKSKKIIDGLFYHTPLHADGSKTLIASGGTIWDLDRERISWASKGNELQAILAFLPGGRTFVGWSRNEKIPDGEKTTSKLVHWDMEADREIRRLPGRSFAAISADGKTCFGAAQTYRWFRWDFASAKELESVDAPTEPAWRIAFSPDGKYVATSDGSTLHIWNRATGKRLHHEPLLGGGPFFFTPDSATLVHHAGDPSLFMLDMETWKQRKRNFEQPLVAAYAVRMYYSRLSPDGKVLAAPIGLWDWASGTFVGRLEHTLPDGTVVNPTEPMAFAPDNKQLTCLGTPGKRVQVWSLVDRKLLSDKVLSDWPKELGFRDLQLIDGGKLLAASWLPPRPPWRGMPRTPEASLQPIPEDWPATMPPMPDAVVHVWDAATGKKKFRLQYPQNENMSEMPPLFSPDGKLLVTANFHDEVVHFRDLASGKEVGRFRCGVKGVFSMTFSPDSRVLAVSAKDTTVLLVDVRKVTSLPSSAPR
jgi:WD40 repeat protein